jgi:predicted transcriptional regulator of viral defense system
MTFMPEKWVLDRLYPVADAQLGYFTTRQAEELGVDRRYLTHHLRSGNLDRVDRGIYRLRNYPRHRSEDVMATILWVGDGAVASHATALAIYDLADAMPAVIHISVDRRFRGRRSGVVVHKGRLPEDDVTNRGGIPVTTPLRTIADVAADASVATAAASEAIERGLVRTSQLHELAQQRPNLAGIFSRLLSR